MQYIVNILALKVFCLLIMIFCFRCFIFYLNTNVSVCGPFCLSAMMVLVFIQARQCPFISPDLNQSFGTSLSIRVSTCALRRRLETYLWLESIQLFDGDDLNAV